MYRTGDIAARSAARGLMYAGRADRQRKVRGFRVEPAEIEHWLRGLPDITDAVVRVAPTPAGDTVLVAYVVPVGPLDRVTVRARLAAHLPSYLLPDVLVSIEAVPLGDSGKIAEERLPDWRVVSAGAPDVDWTPAEEIVRSLWSDVLGVPIPSRDARFFDLGGTSFTLVKVHAALRDKCGVNIPIAELFDRPTVRSLSELTAGRAIPGTDPATQPSTGTRAGDRARALRDLRAGRRGER
jgi:hypothetical protein